MIVFSAFLASLRMLNPATISITPMMISQMPTTRAMMTIESNGHASTTSWQ